MAGSTSGRKPSSDWGSVAGPAVSLVLIMALVHAMRPKEEPPPPPPPPPHPPGR